MSKKADAYAEYVVGDLLAGVPGVTARKMFGGHGVYLNGVICGLIADEALYLKAGDSNRAEYETMGSKPFSYETAKGVKAVMSYWEVPADVLEDRERLEEWIRKSAAVSAAAKQTGHAGKHKGGARGKVVSKRRAQKNIR